jgi:hypothetical protein
MLEGLLTDLTAEPAGPVRRPGDRDFVGSAIQRLFQDDLARELDANPDPLPALASRLHDRAGGASPADVEMLLTRVDTNPDALNLLADCFIAGCNGIDALPPAERLSWSLRAARNGYWPAIQDVYEQTRAGDPVTALAWIGFDRVLLLSGCHVLPQAGTASMVMQLQRQVADVMTPAQRALAEQRTRELLSRYGDGAMALNGCAPAQ